MLSLISCLRSLTWRRESALARSSFAFCSLSYFCLSSVESPLYHASKAAFAFAVESAMYMESSLSQSVASSSCLSESLGLSYFTPTLSSS